MQLNLHRLWIFLQVVDHGGFSAAAQKLYMSQPSVSNQVRQLEQSLKCPLVDRSGARARPTAEGKVLADYARRMFLLADEAVGAIAQVQGLQAGELAVGGTSTVGTYLLPSLISRFHERHPSLEYTVRVGNAEQMMSWILEGEVALALFAGRPHADQLVMEDVLTDRLVLIAHPANPLSGRTVLPDKLATQRFLLREQGSATRMLQESGLAKWDLEQTLTMDMSGSETLKQAVKAGLGISLISEHAVVSELADGTLATINVDAQSQTRPVVAAYRGDRLLSPAEQAFLDLLRQEIGDWPQ